MSSEQQKQKEASSFLQWIAVFNSPNIPLLKGIYGLFYYQYHLFDLCVIVWSIIG